MSIYRTVRERCCSKSRSVSSPESRRYDLRVSPHLFAMGGLRLPQKLSDGYAGGTDLFLPVSVSPPSLLVPLADNTIINMGDEGIALLESKNNEIYRNTVEGGEFGIRLNLGSNNNNIYDNTFNDVWGGKTLK